MHKRIDKDNYYLNIAEVVASRSSCLRRHYGAVIVKDDRVVSTGYNGSPRGYLNCCDVGECNRDLHNCKKGEGYHLCLSGDTRIRLLNGTSPTINELVNNKITTTYVNAVNYEGCIVPAIAQNIRSTGIRSDMCRIVFDNDTYLDCTRDHRIMMRDLSFKEASQLSVGDSVMPYDGDKKVKEIIMMDNPTEVYDLEVPDYHNFAVDLGNNSGVFVHNCSAVHAEQNALLNVSFHDTVGSTIYIVGIEHSTGSYADPHPCHICKRFIQNAGVSKVIMRDVDGSVLIKNSNEI